jgi:uncharacterized protein DUF4326
MTGPQRIRRSRAAGWRLPAGAVYVGRPTRWGNPFKIGEPVPRESPLFPYLLRAIPTGARLGLLPRLIPYRAQTVVDAYGWWFIEQPGLMLSVREELGGRDLVCWCATPAPGEEDVCHAAFLLAMANEEAGAGDQF